MRRALLGFDDDPHRRRMLALLDAEPRPFDRDRFDPGHFTASAFVLSPDGGSLLLIRHAKLGRWLQPGGHVDPADSSPFAAAGRELREEAGVSDAGGDGRLFDLDVHPIPADPRKGEPPHEHFDLRFLLRSRSSDLKAGDDALAARWVPLATAAATAGDASVRRAAQRILATSASS